jgi:hypothetical protein
MAAARERKSEVKPSRRPGFGLIRIRSALDCHRVIGRHAPSRPLVFDVSTGRGSWREQTRVVGDFRQVWQFWEIGQTRQGWESRGREVNSTPLVSLVTELRSVTARAKLRFANGCAK